MGWGEDGAGGGGGAGKGGVAGRGAGGLFASSLSADTELGQRKMTFRCIIFRQAAD